MEGISVVRSTRRTYPHQVFCKSFPGANNHPIEMITAMVKTLLSDLEPCEGHEYERFPLEIASICPKNPDDGDNHGVRAIGFVRGVPRVILIEIVPKGSELTYHCRLTCPSRGTSTEILCLMRPEMAEYLFRNTGILNEITGKRSHASFRRMQEIDSHIRLSDKCLTTLSHDETLGGFCKTAEGLLAQDGRVLTRDAIGTALSQIMRRKIEGILLTRAIGILLLDGIIDPVSMQSDDEFCILPLFGKAVKARERKAIKDKRIPLEIRLSSKNNLLASKQREETRLQICLRTVEEDIERLNAEVKAVENELVTFDEENPLPD
jgi:hypothetical protein